jgi:hypothetical protein
VRIANMPLCLIGMEAGLGELQLRRRAREGAGFHNFGKNR